MATSSLGQLTVDLVANTAGFERGMTQAERALQSATKEAKRQGDALDRLIGQIDPTVAAYSRLDKMEQQLAAHRKANRLDENDFKVYSAQIQSARDALGQADRALSKTGMTAKQTAAALRGVPAQFTDIAVSLQGGQNPLTVFLQQGGQLKDMFGGAGEAAKALGGYVVGLINPFTVAAAAAVALAVAYKQGSDEATAFNTALVTSGNAAGTTADQLSGLAQEVSDSAGTVHKAAAVLAQLAGSSRIAVDSFDEIAIAAIKWEEATGKAAEETVKDFEKIAKDPVKAIRELNDSMNFLTADIYAQIVALQKQGDTAAAANLAEEQYAAALVKRSDKIVENLGYVETAWKLVKEGAKSAWDAILDIGREATLEEKLKKLREQLQLMQETDNRGRGGRAQFQLGVGGGGNQAEIEKQITDLLVQQAESQKRAAATGAQVAKERAAIAKIDEEAAKKEKTATAYREDAGMRMLDSLRQQHAELQLQATTNEKLGAQAQALARFEQQIADIKSKDQRTADQQSLLASEDLLRAQLKRNVALEQEIAARKQATAEAEKLAAFTENQQNKTQAQADVNADSLTGLGLGEKARERLKEFQRIQAEAQKDQDKLEQQRSKGDISAERYKAETEVLQEELAKRLVMQQDYYNQVDEAQQSFFLGASEGWANWAADAENYSAQASEFVTGTLDTLSSGLADSFMSILDGTASVGEAFQALGEQMVKSIAGALVEMAAQWLVYQAVTLLAGKTTQASAATTLIANAQATAFQASLAAFASTAAIPIVGPVLAPGAAAAAASFAAPLVAGVASSALAGMAHDGIDSVPETGTWLLQKGERVTTAETSAKLDKTLDSVANGVPSNKGSTTVNLIEDASKAGQTRTRLDEDGIQEVIDVWIAKLYSDDDVMEALNRKTGLRGQGQ